MVARYEFSTILHVSGLSVGGEVVVIVKQERCPKIGEDDHGKPLLIDSHGREVVDPVWALLDYVLDRSGPKPLLVEWDTDVPDWPVLRDGVLQHPPYVIEPVSVR